VIGTLVDHVLRSELVCCIMESTEPKPL